MSYYDDETRSLGDINSQSNCRTHNSSKVRLNANTGGAGPLPIITTLFANPISVVDVSVNTIGMREPAILLNFSSIVCLPIGVSVTLYFQIKRSINNGDAVAVGSTYTFSTFAAVLEAEAFSFQFFDPQVEAGNYTYTIELSTNSIIDITPGLTIVNATLSALAVDNA